MYSVYSFASSESRRRRQVQLVEKMIVLNALLVGVFTALLAYYLIYRWKRRRLYELAAKIPGPVGLPLIGIAFELLGKDSKG